MPGYQFFYHRVFMDTSRLPVFGFYILLFQLFDPFSGILYLDIWNSIFFCNFINFRLLKLYLSSTFLFQFMQHICFLKSISMFFSLSKATCSDSNRCLLKEHFYWLVDLLYFSVIVTMYLQISFLYGRLYRSYYHTDLKHFLLPILIKISKTNSNINVR